MTRVQSCMVWAVAVTAMLTAGTSAVAAEKVPVERLLPPNVFALLAVPDVNEFKARWDESTMGQLRRDPELADFWRDFAEQWADWSKQVEQQVGASLDDLLAVPSGEMALAVFQLPNQEIAGIALLDYGDNQETVETLLEQAADALKERNARRTTREIEGTQVVIYSVPREQADDDDDEPGEPRQFAYFLRDNQLVTANSAEALEVVLARWDGQHTRTFADNEVRRHVLERTRTRTGDSLPAVTWFVDPVGLLRAAMAAGGEQNFQAQMIMGFLPALGVNQFRGFGGSYDLATEDYDSVHRMFIYVDFPVTGIIKMFQFPAAEIAPPKWVPDTASTYAGMNWDLNAAYAAVEGLVDLFRGPGSFARTVDGFAEREDGPGIHLKKDVIDQLSGLIHVFNQPADDADDDDEEQTVAPFMLALGLKQTDRMQAVLADIAREEGFPGRAREFRGQTLYEIPTGGLIQQTADTVGFAIFDQHLMIVSDITLLEQVMRGAQDRRPLAESPLYRRIAERFPAKVSTISFQRQDAQIKTVYEALRTGEAADFVQGVDLTKLPPFERIEKYLRPTGGYSVPEERGGLSVSFTLRNAADE